MRWGVILAAASLGAIVWAQAPLTAVEPATTISARVLRMSAGNEVLLQMAQLGEKRGATAAVRRYAHRLKLDTSKTGALLHDKATGLGIRPETLQAEANPALAQVMQPLEAATPAAFDHLFLSAMAREQQQSLARLQQHERQPDSLQSLTRKLTALGRVHLQLTDELLKPGAPV